MAVEGFEDLSDVLLDLILGYECNVQCDYCSVTDEMRRHNLTTREAVAEIVQARALGLHKVSFGGGEPTIRKDLLPLVRLARDRGYDFVKVASNGLLYSYEQFARDAVEAGVTRFHISVMAHTAALYESIMGLRGALDLVERGVKNLIALGQRPILDLIIKNDTCRHLADIVEHWARLGVRDFVLWLVSLTDRNRDNLASLPRVSDMRDAIVRAFERSDALGVACESRHIPRCMLRGYERFVRDLRQDRVIVVTPGSRFRLWESVISANTYTEKCRDCRHYEGDCMGLRRDYLERYGDGEVVPIH